MGLNSWDTPLVMGTYALLYTQFLHVKPIFDKT